MRWHEWLAFIAIVWLGIALFTQEAVAHHRQIKKFDHYFKHYHRRYAAPEVKRDWRLQKAVCQVESSLNPNAVSPVGAKGLCQFLDSTWADWSPPNTTPLSAKDSIKASSRYLRWLYGNWEGRPRKPIEIWKLSLSSYNSGIRSILRAQMKCEDALDWEIIKLCLHEVTGHHSFETINYVSRNEQAYKRLGGRRSW